jgi:hypothetical protein
MFIEPYYNYNEIPMWRGVPIFPEEQIRAMPYSYNNYNAGKEAIPATPAVMPQVTKVAQHPIKDIQQPAKVITQPSKSMPQTTMPTQQPSKVMPQMQADYQNPEITPTAPIINNPLYNQGWLKTQIGKFVSINFLIGNMYIDRQGILQEVGISYVIIKESGTNDIVMCDIYSIKFVTVFGDQNKCRV